MMVEVMGVSLKTEQRSSHSSRGLPWAMGEADGGPSGNLQLRPCIGVPVRLRRPPSLPLICRIFPDHASFSVLRETPMTFASDHFKTIKCYEGFTLLEVLVSMAILVIIMAALYSAYTTNVEAIQIARQNGEVHQAARIVLERMTKDLQSAMIQVSMPSEKIKLGLVGEDREIDGRRADRIDFTTVTHLALNEKVPASDLCEIGYMIEEDPEAKTLVLFRRDDPSVDEDFTTGGSLQEMARNVLEFKLTYEDSRGEESTKWNTLEGMPASGLPVLIKIRLVLKDELDREHLFSTTIHPELAERIRER